MAGQLTQGDALLVVDVQNDFCPGGALGAPEGDRIVPVLNRWIDRARSAGVPTVFSRDWHPPDHCSFQDRGGPWPVHCVAGTPGAEFHPDLNVPPDAIEIKKATAPDREAYSAFDETEAAERLRELGVERLWVGGLATDYCVRQSVLDALKAGFEVRVIEPAVRAVNVEPGDDRRALDEMRQAGAVIEPEA